MISVAFLGLEERTICWGFCCSIQGGSPGNLFFGRIRTVGGPQPLVNGVRPPISRVKSLQISHLFSAIYQACKSPFCNDRLGAQACKMCSEISLFNSSLPNIQDIFQWPIHDKSGSLERLRFGSEKLGFTGVSPGFVGAESSSCWKKHGMHVSYIFVYVSTVYVCRYMCI